MAPTSFYPILLAGGSGTRLWPLSRSLLPKHLLSLQGDKTLIQNAAHQLSAASLKSEYILVVTHKEHEFEVRKQLTDMSLRIPFQVLAESQANNTLPAIAWGVAIIAQKNPDAVIGVFPSDHSVTNLEGFYQDIAEAINAAERGYFVTLGIKPTSPETGYGYLESSSTMISERTYRVSSFKEKPDRPTAEKYLRDGNYYWNSGMFFFRAQDFQEALKKLEPAIYESIQKIVRFDQKSSQVEAEYARMKSISMDYGLMEKVDNVAVVPASFGWNDLGSWEAIYQEMEKDTDGNVVQGDVVSQDSRSSLLISRNGHLAAIGLENMVVIQTDDAVLVSPRDRVQDVKKIVEALKEKGSSVVHSHATVSRPWGTYTVLEEGPFYKIKRIVVYPGQKLSLQRHEHRAEHWVVIQGSAEITNGDAPKILRKNESTFIPMGQKHRLANPGETDLVIIEVQTGGYLGEDDIQRFDDVYGRA